MKNVMDVLFINPGSAKDVYQGLSTDYSGIGTPYWALLLAQSCRSQNYKVGILDILAENKYNFPLLVSGGMVNPSQLDKFKNLASGLVLSSALHYNKLNVKDFLN